MKIDIRPLAALGLLTIASCNQTTSERGATSVRTGTVIGGIEPCLGIGYPGMPRYAAGTVAALRGSVEWKKTGQGGYVEVFPSTVVDSQTVKKNKAFRLALPPGHYVLKAKYAVPSNMTPFVQITIREGKVLHRDIPNTCK